MTGAVAADSLVLRPDAPDGEWVLRHVAVRRSYRLEDYADAAQRALTYVFRAFLGVVAIIVLFAFLAATRYDWPPGVFLIPIFAAAIIFAFCGSILAARCAWDEAASAEFFPRRVYVYRDRVVVVFPGRPLWECPNRTMTVGWGWRGDDSYSWRPGSERALLLRYWGWQHVPGPWIRPASRVTFAITGPEDQLATAYSLLINLGIRRRRPTFAELLAPVLFVAALAAGVWAAW